MMEADTAVGGGVEEGTPEQRLSFRRSPIGKDRRGIENAVRTVAVECLIGRTDGACTGERQSERETLRTESGLSIGEHTSVGSLRVVPQLGGRVFIMLLGPSAETLPARARPGIDQSGQVEGPTSEDPCILSCDLREKRGRVVQTAPLRKALDLLAVHRKHGNRSHGLLIWSFLWFASGMRRSTALTAERVDEHLLG